MASYCDQINGHATAGTAADTSSTAYTMESDVFASPIPSVNRSSSSVIPTASKETKAVTPQRTSPLPSNIDTMESFDKRLSMPDLTPKTLDDRQNLYKKFEHIKVWSVSTYKCTKQVIEEKIGTSVPTCDHDMDLRIESLKQIQKHYLQLLDDIKLYSSNLTKLIQSQQQLLAQLNFLGQHQSELANMFTYNTETQRFSAANREKLLAALDIVQKGISTLVNQTIGDTMLTIRHMNMARLEFDAYRKEADLLRRSPKKATERRVAVTLGRLNNSQSQFVKLKAAVDAKLRLLHENRVRVMNHNLSLLYEATSAYYSGSEQKLNDALKHFNVKVLPSPTVGSAPLNNPTKLNSTVEYRTTQTNSNLGPENSTSQSYVHFPYTSNAGD